MTDKIDVDELLARLGKMRKCVYLACEETVAEQLAVVIEQSAATIRRLRAAVQEGMEPVADPERIAHCEIAPEIDVIECARCGKQCETKCNFDEEYS
jgi:uncharacterized protein (DUF2126 family)